MVEPARVPSGGPPGALIVSCGCHVLLYTTPGPIVLYAMSTNITEFITSFSSALHCFSRWRRAIWAALLASIAFWRFVRVGPGSCSGCGVASGRPRFGPRSFLLGRFIGSVFLLFPHCEGFTVIPLSPMLVPTRDRFAGVVWAFQGPMFAGRLRCDSFPARFVPTA